MNYRAMPKALRVLIKLLILKSCRYISEHIHHTEESQPKIDRQVCKRLLQKSKAASKHLKEIKGNTYDKGDPCRSAILF